MLGDWFEKVHALAPVLHRRRLMYRLKTGEANTDRTFCALVVSVCAATVATLRRADYSPVTVERCIDFIEEHHLLDHGLRQPSYSLDWCIAMYNIGTSASSMNENGLGDMGSFHGMSEAAAGRDSQLDTGPQLSAAELPPWHGDTASYVPGLNQLSELFLIWHEAQTAPVSLYGGQEEALKHFLSRIQTTIDNFPPSCAGEEDCPGHRT
ncbi:hypothetical protein Ct61P_01716 [Colletotrichum tofieldiae]|nr:hypothetical protein Ct61P_01716 [Colletotrichum tofieldiae]